MQVAQVIVSPGQRPSAPILHTKGTTAISATGSLSIADKSLARSETIDVKGTAYIISALFFRQSSYSFIWLQLSSARPI